MQLRGYAFAIISVAVALGAALLLQRLHFRDASVSLLLFAGAISSWYGGTGPAVLTVLLSIIGFDYFFLVPFHSLRIGPSDLPYFIIFASFASLISWFATIRRHVEEALRRSERELRRVIETIPTFAWTALPDGSVNFVNRHWLEYTGLSIEETVGSGWDAAVHPGDVKRYAEKWRASVASGEPFEQEVRFRGAGGQYRWFLTRAVPLREAGGEIVKWYGTSTDIEDRKRAEQLQADLAHMNRVSTMGELAASISHELKQPISATILNANASLRLLNRDRPEIDSVREATKSIVQDGNRATEILDRLRSLYKKSPPQRELVEVNEIVREMVALLRGEATRHGVSIRTNLADDLPRITADRVQMQQVLMNLMLNGIEAMSDMGGVLTVKSELDQKGQVRILVSDTGVGLPAEKADQIFNAFFTTKAQGSGMGLAISRSIIESHAGRLWATSNDGRGATFHFTVPTTVEEVNVTGTGT
jgi:PAS domain S-box-containing protein